MGDSDFENLSKVQPDLDRHARRLLKKRHRLGRILGAVGFVLLMVSQPHVGTTKQLVFILGIAGCGFYAFQVEVFRGDAVRALISSERFGQTADKLNKEVSRRLRVEKETAWLGVSAFEDPQITALKTERSFIARALDLSFWD